MRFNSLIKINPKLIKKKYTYILNKYVKINPSNKLQSQHIELMNEKINITKYKFINCNF